MKNDEAGVYLIIFIDNPNKFGPGGGVDVAGIDGLFKLIYVDGSFDVFHFGNVVAQMVEIQGLQSTRSRVASHSNRSTGID